MALKIDYHSLISAIGGETYHLMVYGFSGCKYSQLNKFIRTADPFEKGENPIKRVFDYRIGHPYKLRSDGSKALWDPIAKKSYTLEGREIFAINHANLRIDHVIKAALVNIVIENVKRQREGLPLIPVLFAIDISSDTSGQYPPSTKDIINIRTRYTFKELRRVYKLCTDLALPTEVRNVAERTFKFVKVLVSTSAEGSEGTSSADLLEKKTTLAFETIKAPWQKDLQSWQAAMAAYAERKKIIEAEPAYQTYIEEKKEKGFEWRPQLLEAIGL